MITREQIYGKEATEIFRYVTTYYCITRNHLLRIYPDREKQIDNLLKYLLRQGRIFTSPNTADIFLTIQSVAVILLLLWTERCWLPYGYMLTFRIGLNITMQESSR